MSGNTSISVANMAGLDVSSFGCLDESMLSAMGNISMDMVAMLGTNMSSCTGGSAGDTVGYDDFEALKDYRITAAVIVLYVIVMIIGALGNSMVVITVIRTPALWNATNIFIANLAVADILVCVLDLPVSLYYQLTDNWIFGKVLCHILPCILGVVVYSSVQTLMLIAIDR